MHRIIALPAALPILVSLVLACAGVPPRSDADDPAAQGATPDAVLARVIEVHKSPTCGCCHQWEEYLRHHGRTVRSVPGDDLAALKAAHGVPAAARSCHTAIVDGYVVEGHVPVEAIDDLLATRPDVTGIALPGMPAGSPGMPGQKEAPFEILAFSDAGTTVFGSY